jgi:hypothetical protein
MLRCHPIINNKNRRTMKTMNILKSLVGAMLMPAMLFTTSCGNEDEVINGGATAKQGYKIPVTVNVTRQGDKAATRATYDSETRKLSFSAGDQLFIEGGSGSLACDFAGTLTYDAESGKFSGELSTSIQYTGTYEELFTAASDPGDGDIKATLLPAGYMSYGFLSIDDTFGADQAYLDAPDYDYSVAADKATAIEQFSLEQATTYSSGFALAPQNAIINCSIKSPGDVEQGEECWPFLENDDDIFGDYVEIYFGSNNIVQFAIAVPGNLGDQSWMLRDDYSYIDIDLGTKNLEAGKIYNVKNYTAVADAFKNGKTTEFAFTSQMGNLTLSAEYSSGSFTEVTTGGTLAGMVSAASMEKDGNNLVINVTVTGVGPGTMTINTLNNTYSWSNATVGAAITLSDITIGGNSIDVMPQALLSLTVSDPDNYVGGDKTLYYVAGETWRNAIANHPENAGWIYYNDIFPTYTGYTNNADVRNKNHQAVTSIDVIDETQGYNFGTTPY